MICSCGQEATTTHLCAAARLCYCGKPLLGTHAHFEAPAPTIFPVYVAWPPDVDLATKAPPRAVKPNGDST